MNSWTKSAILIFCLLTACCPVVSVNPLSAPGDVDQRLVGAWKLTSEEHETVYAHIGIRNDNLMEMVSVEHKDNGTIETFRVNFFVTRSGELNYINVKMEELEEEMARGRKGYLFIKYSFSEGNNLTFSYLDPDAVVDAILKQELKGEFTYKKAKPMKSDQPDSTHQKEKIECARITDSPPNILNFLLKAKDKTFIPDGMTFQRMD